MNTSMMKSCVRQRKSSQRVSRCILPHLGIFPYPEVHSELPGKKAYRFDIQSRDGDGRGDNMRDVLFGLRKEVANCLKPGISERGVAELPVCGGIGSIQAYRYRVYQTGKFGQDIPGVNQVGLSVGIYPDPVASGLELCRDLFHQIQPYERFAVAAEDDLVTSSCREDRVKKLICRRLPVEHQVVALDGKILEFGAEGAAV